MACGVTLAFLFLAIYASGAIEASAIKAERARRRAARSDRLTAVLEAYRPRIHQLQALARQGDPPANWRFPRGPFSLDDTLSESRPDTAVITWRQLGDPKADSPLDHFFPKGFRHGLYFSTMPASHADYPRALDTRIERALDVHLLVVTRVESLEPAGRPSSTRGSEGSHAKPWATPLHSRARVVLRAYLYDLDADPCYKGCLEISGQSPEAASSLYVDPLTGMVTLSGVAIEIERVAE